MEPVNTSLPQKEHSGKNIVLFLLVVLGFAGSFAGGYIASVFLAQETGAVKIPGTTVKPTLTPAPTPKPEEESFSLMNFSVGKHYFDDTILLVTKTAPYYTLVGSVTRTQRDIGYLQNTRASFFDGSGWVRKTEAKETSSGDIENGALVTSWQVAVHPSRLLREQATGSVSFPGSDLRFTAGNLQNEMVIRSLPGYTKLMSEGSGTLTINGISYRAHVLYTRIYSVNAAEIQFYSAPIGVTTDWLAFWDTDGNFYHIDVSDVARPTDIYKTHQLGVIKDQTGSVEKTFGVSVRQSEGTPPSEYSFTLDTGAQPVISFTKNSELNKSPDGLYTWFLMTGSGAVKTANGKTATGIGIAEYIHD